MRRAPAKLRLLLVGALSAASCSGTEGDLLSRLPVPQDLGTDLPPLTQCITAVLGDGKQCQTEADWRTSATQACNAAAGVLSASGAFEACGTDTFHYLKYACCPAGMGGCYAEVQGGPTSCKSTATWLSYAALSCSATNAMAQGPVPYESCGADSYRYVKYLCCLTK